ncbi:MAG: PPC domain-containing protein, partial [Myxococcota bacterium]
GPQTVDVRDTLRVALLLENPENGVGFRYEGPSGLPGIAQTASISGSPAGGEFRWTPQSNHVGTHEFQVILVDSDGDEVDRTPMVVTVNPSADSAPVFLRPGAGGTYDLEREPCVQFSVDVRDDDSLSVTIDARGLPEGAELRQDRDKSALFNWCPTPEQVAESERWTIQLTADDGDRNPTELNFVIVLRTGNKEGCPGAPPSVTIESPTMDQRVDSEPGYSVVIRVTDDLGLRDAPLLYHTTATPDDPENPDVTLFEQITFEEDDGDRYRIRIPPLGLEDGQEQTVFLVASATDNDDPEGAACDKRTDTALLSFTAIGGSGSGLPACERCTASAQCSSGVCAASASGARCVDSCAGGEACAQGTCGELSTAEGSTVAACGDVDAACGTGSGGSCTDDSNEENDTIATATPVTSLISGQVCSGDDDYYRINATPGTEISVTIDGFMHASGDLDLQLRSADGAVLSRSGGVEDFETATYCSPTADPIYARVFGYRTSENAYDLSVSTAAGNCCVDDVNEDDDSIATARAIVGTDFDGTICPGDDDYVSLMVAGPSTIAADLVFDPAIGDLDFELYSPAGSVIAFSRGMTGTESINHTVADPGTYTLRVFGFSDAAGDYLGEATVTASAGGCMTSNDCPTDDACFSGACMSRSCTQPTDCPTGEVCPAPGPTAPVSECGMSCGVNRDCRSAEACKRFPEGRYCARRGSGQNGDACTTFADCGGQRACLPYTDGYCARAGCTSNSDCESGTFCITIGTTNVCALDCWASSSICRMGYDCDVETDLDGFLQFACIPL